MVNRTYFRLTDFTVQVPEQLDPYWVRFFTEDGEPWGSHYLGDGKYLVNGVRGSMFYYEICPDLISDYNRSADDISSMLNTIINATNFNQKLSEEVEGLEVPNTDDWYDSQVEGAGVTVDYYIGDTPNINARQLNPAGLFIVNSQRGKKLHIWTDQDSIALVKNNDDDPVVLVKNAGHFVTTYDGPVKVVTNVL